MITQLVAEVRQQIETYEHLQRAASQVALIKTTAESLTDLYRDLKTWSQIYPATEPYLSEDQKTELVKQASKLRQRLLESQTRFANDYAQRDALKQPLQLIKKLTDDTARCWTLYAETRLSSVRDQVAFARQLPRMRNEEAEIGAMAASLATLAQKLPQRVADVKAFHSQLAALEQRLHDVKGLTREQTAFLNKAQAGTATLNDMTESLLEWCKQEGLATLLKIKF